MTVSETTRFGLIRWSDDTDPFTRSQMDQSHQNIEDRAARVIAGTSAPSPSAQYARTFFYNTSTSQLYFYAADDEFGSWAEVVGNFIPLDILNTKGDLPVATADDTVGILSPGTNGQKLVVDSSTATGLKWASDTQNTVIDAKGDLIVGTSADTASKLAAGTDGYTLVAASGQATGLQWSNSLSGYTISGSTVSNATVTNPVFRSPEERWSVAATAATGTVNVDCLTSSAVYLTSDATGNWTTNFRGDSGTALASVLEINDSISVILAVKQGATPYLSTTFRVDTSITPTVLWQGGTTFPAGNANSVDVYAFTLLRTGASAYTLFASQTKFAS